MTIEASKRQNGRKQEARAASRYANKCINTNREGGGGRGGDSLIKVGKDVRLVQSSSQFLSIHYGCQLHLFADDICLVALYNNNNNMIRVKKAMLYSL